MTLVPLDPKKSCTHPQHNPPGFTDVQANETKYPRPWMYATGRKEA